MPGARFPSTAALRRLGISDPQVFFPEGGRMTPTLQVADLSKSVATEPVEARGYFSLAMAGRAGDRGQVELHCRAPGGLIIEFFQYLDPPDLVPFNPATGIFISVENQSFLVDEGFGIPADFGGLATRSSIIAGRSGIGFIGRLASNKLSGTPIYVPAGSFFRMHSRALGANFSPSLLWRELPDIQPV